MNKINQNPDYRNNHGYQGFELHHEVDFSSSCGHAIPCLYDILNPGDKIDLDFLLKTRTQPLDGHAEMSLEECIDVFFVPMEQIYKPFGSQYYGVNDLNSDFFNGVGGGITSNFPYFTLEQLKSCLDNLYYKSDIAGTASPFNSPSSENLRANAVRLLDALGFPMKAIYGPQAGSGYDVTTISMSSFPILLAAYQKICYDVYRIGDRINNEPMAYNMDSLYNNVNTAESPTFVQNRLKMLLKLHHVPYAKDFFTNCFISPIAGQGDPSMLNTDALKQVNQWLSGLKSVKTGQPASSYEGAISSTNNSPTSVRLPKTGSGTMTENQIQGMINPANIRALYASEKLQEIVRRAGKHYDMQTLAHFGVNVPSGIAGEVFYIGSHRQELNIGDVVSTADTALDTEGDVIQLAPLGKIAGRGWSIDKSKDIKFTAPCHGVLMAIYYARPSAKYWSFGFDKLNTLVNPADFYRPEFDGLGMQPLFRYQSDYRGEVGPRSTIIGWQYRFMELKAKPSKVMGILSSSLSYWAFHKNAPLTGGWSEFYVKPTDMNGLFAKEFSYNLGTATEPNQYTIYQKTFDSDPLLHFLKIGYNKSAKMSTYGLPNL